MPSGYFLFKCERICRYGMRIIGRTQPTVSAMNRHQEPRIPADQICRTSPRVWLSSVHRRNARRASFAKRQPLTAILRLCGMSQSSNPHADRDLGSGFTRNALRGPFVARLQHAIFNETAKDGQARDDNVAINDVLLGQHIAYIKTHPSPPCVCFPFSRLLSAARPVKPSFSAQSS